jgi:hypothetical protein
LTFQVRSLRRPGKRPSNSSKSSAEAEGVKQSPTVENCKMVMSLMESSNIEEIRRYELFDMKMQGLKKRERVVK